MVQLLLIDLYALKWLSIVTSKTRIAKSAVQPALPGMAALARPRRRVDHTRVWSDPDVGEAAADSERRYDEWRQSFMRFLAGLPARRRAELRRRIAGVDGVQRTERRLA